MGQTAFQAIELSRSFCSQGFSFLSKWGIKPEIQDRDHRLVWHRKRGSKRLTSYASCLVIPLEKDTPVSLCLEISVGNGRVLSSEAIPATAETLKASISEILTKEGKLLEEYSKLLLEDKYLEYLKEYLTSAQIDSELITPEPKIVRSTIPFSRAKSYLAVSLNNGNKYEISCQSNSKSSRYSIRENFDGSPLPEHASLFAAKLLSKLKNITPKLLETRHENPLKLKEVIALDASTLELE